MSAATDAISAASSLCSSTDSFSIMASSSDSLFVSQTQGICGDFSYACPFHLKTDFHSLCDLLTECGPHCVFVAREMAVEWI